MNVVWLGFGICVGIGLGWLIRAAVLTDIEQENESLRRALANVRTMAQLGSSGSIVRAVDRALGQEVAA